MAEEQFENIDISLTEEDWEELVSRWLAAKLAPASLSLFREALSQTDSFQEAVLLAIRNEAIIDALEKIVKQRQQGKQHE